MTARGSCTPSCWGRLRHIYTKLQSFSYDVRAPWFDTQCFYDFSSNQYNITGMAGPYAGVKYLPEMPSANFWSAEALAGAGIR